MDENSAIERLLSKKESEVLLEPSSNSETVETVDVETPLTPSSPNKNRIPVAVFFIIGNEICERFSFYGLKAILALYLHNTLDFEESTATSLVHAFVMVAYAMTLFGGWLSDSYLGKFTTVVALSLVYVLGGALLSITALPDIAGPWGAFLSLTLIAIGTGGIKPVVSSFLGDQFGADQSELITRVFMYFYFAINLGSVASTLITPSIRTHWSYAAAFGLPAALLFVATLIFIAGKPRYRRNPPAGSVVGRCFGAVVLALRRTISKQKGAPPVNHWLDRARDRYGAVVISDLRIALRACTLFLPLPFFWALFDQHASRFIFQATRMDRNVFGYAIEADQVPFLNPLMVLILIPIFDYGVYPGLKKAGVNFTPLRRIGTGMFLASTAFAAASILESAIDSSEVNSVHIAWQLPQYFLLTVGEVLLSITGLEFAYTQSPVSLKALVSALWQLTVAGGNLIVILVASSKLLEQVYEYALFACLMLVALAIFALLARRYTYVNASSPAASDAEE